MRGAQSDKGCFMAKIFENGRWKKRTLTALSVALATSLSLGIFSACDAGDDEDDDDTVAAQTDTQLIKNGNFEFYGDKPLAAEKRKNFINSPDSWTNSRGSDSLGTAPSSDTKSGIVDAKEWETLSVSKLGENKFSSIADAMARWEQGSIYDRLKFYDEFEDELDDLDSKSEEKEFFAKYNYSIDFEDVEKLNEEIGTLSTRYGANDEAKDDNTNVLMIHNQKKTDSVWGTAQYYTSGTTVTLEAGTSAKVSVWVKTASLKHWYEGVEAKTLGGAYIGVTHTVGGTTLDQMQIKNINTKDVESDNGWEQYTLYVRASTFATSTFRIVLGLGFGSSTDMYETINGYAFFDDLTCSVITNDAYEEKTQNITAPYTCDIRDYGEDKKFTAGTESQSYALDLYADFTDVALTNSVEIGLTKETYGGREYTTETYAPISLSNSANNYAQVASPKAMKEADNKYLKAVLEKDFAKYPFDEEQPIVMLMSANGATYTAKSPSFSVPAGEKLLVSFFVKTSEMKGFKGAGISVVDGDNKTSINPFDSTTVAKVDINDDVKDIYDGWAQCFFFISNDTEETKSFSLEATYGSQTVVGTTKADYTDGYAAFANFQTYAMSETEMSYVSTGDRAVSVSLTGKASATSKFDDVAMNDSDSVKTDIAKPANYLGVQGGDKRVGGEIDSAFSPAPEGVYAGLVNSDHTDAYENTAWKTALCEIAAQKGVLTQAVASDWWDILLGTAKQPLAIINKVESAYGYLAHTTTNLASSGTRRHNGDDRSIACDRYAADRFAVSGIRTAAEKSPHQTAHAVAEQGAVKSGVGDQIFFDDRADIFMIGNMFRQNDERDGRVSDEYG